MKHSITFTGTKTQTVKKLINSILDIFDAIHIPCDGTDRKLEKMAMACLSLGDIHKSLSKVKSCSDERFLTTRDIIKYENDYFAEGRSSGSYDDVRRQDLVLLVESGIVIKSSDIAAQAVNSPTRGYGLSENFATLIGKFGKTDWEKALKEYNKNAVRLTEELQRRRQSERIPVMLPNGQTLSLSYGEHNQLQKKVVEDFLPIFGMGAKLLYLGDTENKYLFLDKEGLASIGFFEIAHEELPDIVAYSSAKEILFLVEAFHSTGPMSEIRVRRLKTQLFNCKATVVFVTAFIDRKAFKKHVDEIAWETEVWIAENPEHLVHFNGYKFLEMHK